VHKMADPNEVQKTGDEFDYLMDALWHDLWL